MTYTQDLEARLEYAQEQASRYAKMAATLKAALGDAGKLDQKLEALREEFPEMNPSPAAAVRALPVKFDLDGIEGILRQAGKPLHMTALAEAAGYQPGKLRAALHRSTRFENQGGNTWWVSGEAIPEAASEGNADAA